LEEAARIRKGADVLEDSKLNLDVMLQVLQQQSGWEQGARQLSAANISFNLFSRFGPNQAEFEIFKSANGDPGSI